MIEVNFYECVDDNLLKFAVIVSKYNGKWIFCKHRRRDTFEVPGGHREPDETILAAAKRELYEETGATNYSITPVCVYSVVESNGIAHKNSETFGMLFFADISTLGQLPGFEIEEVRCFDDLPDKLTYPHIQPKLIAKVKIHRIRKMRQSTLQWR